MKSQRSAKLKRQNKKAVAWEAFDDCPICQAMKAGTASTEEGLLKAFAGAKKKGKHISY